MRSAVHAPRPPSRKSSSSEKTSSSAYVFLGRDATRALMRSGADGSRRDERLGCGRRASVSRRTHAGRAAAYALARLVALSLLGQRSLERDARRIVLPLGVVKRLLSSILGVERLLQRAACRVRTTSSALSAAQQYAHPVHSRALCQPQNEPRRGRCRRRPAPPPHAHPPAPCLRAPSARAASAPPPCRATATPAREPTPGEVKRVAARLHAHLARWARTAARCRCHRLADLGRDRLHAAHERCEEATRQHGRHAPRSALRRCTHQPAPPGCGGCFRGARAQSRLSAQARARAPRAGRGKRLRRRRRPSR